LRTESRLSHFREDYEGRDDQNWLAWVDIADRDGKFTFDRTPVLDAAMFGRAGIAAAAA